MGIRSLSTASISTGAKRSKVWDQSAVYTPSSYESIATITVGSGGASNMEFTSIPSTYTHLQVRLMARSNRAGVTNDSLHIQFNSDTGSTYDDHYLVGDGATVSSAADTTVTNIGLYRIVGAAPAANIFGVSIIDIFDYKNANKYKVVRALTGNDSNGDGRLSLGSGNWRSTSAITSIKLFPNSGSSSFIQYSTAALYGIKA